MSSKVCICMLAVSLLLPLAVAAQDSPSRIAGGISVTYQRATVPVLNPDGGLDVNADLANQTSAQLANLTESYPTYGVNDTYGPVRLLHTYICLNPVGAAPGKCSNTNPSPTVLSSSDLAMIDQQLSKIQPAGVKVILRFTYNFPNENESTGDDAPLEVILQDINLLSPLVKKYSNVIYAMEVGFVGYWGEEHNSSYGNNTISNMSAILQAEATEFGPYVTLLERDPVVLMALEPPSSPLFGIHDDRLAGDATDADTWKNKDYLEPTYDYSESAIRAFGQSRSAIQPFTGIFGTYYPTLQNCQDLPAYFAQVHLAALDIGDGDSQIYTNIQDCIPSVFYTVGPQISLLSATTDVSPRAGSTVHLTLALTNYGDSSLYVKHPVYAVVLDSYGNPLPSASAAPVALDITQIQPGSKVNASATVPIPRLLPSSGKPSLALWMPDPDPKLAVDHRYNYLLNNEGVPNPATGYNVLFSFNP